ncbi:MAG: rRNA maturation RNase YbeY [Actinomycetia bacterium]|nr:rRNA maturation RNase YbeY [Actinomycetes bacterium]
MIDITNESGLPADELGLVALARFTLRRMRIHPQAEVSILLVDEPTMAEYHLRFMNEPGPTDVMSFPMDELRPPRDDEEEPPKGLLGDVVLCPAVAARQAPNSGRTTDEEAEYLLVHGLLHLLGFDHAEPEEKAQMFGLNDEITQAWAARKHRR